MLQELRINMFKGPASQTSQIKNTRKRHTKKKQKQQPTKQWETSEQSKMKLTTKLLRFCQSDSFR